ncbi:hypothetical protein SAMD00023353_0602500 [Rosellinia necatrix]|uniref:Uncharacterized protein n=1 Tax=Rosellinia necatrix TaxID=77044 RepID=A0A1S7UL06_ROSNE|nr:hypothetical protein SAMD00023353_0602500 [Rosellinia necatrix]
MPNRHGGRVNKFHHRHQQQQRKQQRQQQQLYPQHQQHQQHQKHQQNQQHQQHQQHQQYQHQQQHQHQQQQQAPQNQRRGQRQRNLPRQPLDISQEAVSTALAMQFLEHFRGEILETLATDVEGDVRMCECLRPDSVSCIHGIARLYQGQLVSCARLQYDIVKLLMFLMSKDESAEAFISTWLREYVARDPDTPLKPVLQTMGFNGPVNVGIGAPVGTGVGVLLDGGLEEIY